MAADPPQNDDPSGGRDQRLNALHQQLAEGVEALRDGDAWRDWLRVAASFHRYSFNNQILILAQNPNATHVAGYRAWQALGRQVRKGEKALYILAPVTPRAGRGEQQGSDYAAEDIDSPTEQHQGRGPRPRFRGTAVFDLAQTEGEPLPRPPAAQLLAGQAPPGLWDALAAAIQDRGYTVTRSPDATTIFGANGLTDALTRTVTVRADVSDAQAVKTLAHEAGHVLLHATDPTSIPTCRDLIEVEAESVAYLVAAHHGLDTSDYTFAYIAGWAGRDRDAVTTTATRVLGAARILIDATDPVAQPPSNSAERRIHQETTLAQPVLAEKPAPGDIHRAGDLTREILNAAQRYFSLHAQQSEQFATAARNRGHDLDTALRWGLGWAPPAWTGLVDHLRELGYRDSDLLAAGVAFTNHGRTLDRLRGRVIFPITDAGQIVGWTARDTTGRVDVPKYLNSPTSGHYDKSRLLYGSDHLHPDTSSVVLVEGPWDALAVTATNGPHSVGLATCGTAVTAHHVTQAAAASRRLILGVDNDPAGRKALSRTIQLVDQLHLPHPAAVTSSHGKDLADQHANNPGALRTDLAAARPAGLVYAELVLAQSPPAETAEERIGLARTAAAQAADLQLGDRAALASLLITRIGITAEAALDITTPPLTRARPRATADRTVATPPPRPRTASTASQ